MFINSFVKSDFGFRPVKVEVVLVPGVSQIQILGLADQQIKESSKRIVSALRHQGFRIPPGKQALVNLHPNYLRKTSQGLDLAIALGILVESEQIEEEVFDFKNFYVYGGLSLKGEVVVPSDLSLLNFENFNKSVLSGRSKDHWRFDTYQLSDLAQINELSFCEAKKEAFYCEPMDSKEDLFFEQNLARLMMIVAVGEHPMLIAGFAGCGKTTLVENLATLLCQPEEKSFLEAKKYWMLAGRDLRTRPIVQPHHSATPASMIGGGSSLKFGEISLAHGGALILDELLEFHPLVQSSLREPMEKGKIYISRAGSRKVFPADSLVLATTNLCPCGNFEPGNTYACRCSALRLRSYVERLTGPFLDRFAIFNLYEKPKIDLKLSLKEIKNTINKTLSFQKEQYQKRRINQKLSISELVEELDSGINTNMIPATRSHRRHQSLLRVSRTIADLEGAQKIKQQHLEEAQKWTASDIYKLERFRMEDFAVR